MDIRTAILKAADHIEDNPGLFVFNNVIVPECRTPGCALGWIGYFGDSKRGRSIEHDKGGPVKRLGLSSQLEFYEQMDKLECGYYGGGTWRRDYKKCAELLRLYADKYHPAIVTTPDWEGLAKPDGKTFEPAAESSPAT